MSWFSLHLIRRIYSMEIHSHISRNSSTTNNNTKRNDTNDQKVYNRRV